MMLSRIRDWRERRRTVRDSQIQVYASRKTTFPLEQCNAENLRTAARYNRRKAIVLVKSPNAEKQSKIAGREWNLLAADALESLARKLKDGQTVEDLSPRKRRGEVETMLRITKGKAK